MITLLNNKKKANAFFLLEFYNIFYDVFFYPDFL